MSDSTSTPVQPKHLIEVRALSRHFGDFAAVRGISFSVDRGQVLGFLGVNGAGKSTTMKMLAGVLTPSAGAISIGGVDLLESPKAAKANLGYLPEQPPLYREFTVDEYLKLLRTAERRSQSPPGDMREANQTALRARRHR